MKWTQDQIPNQTGRTIVVTGANTGIGFETARALANKGAQVVLACRDEKKAQEAISRIEAEAPSSRCEFAPLDLSDLSSVASFAQTFTSKHARLDLLINNAGVMTPPKRSLTKDQFELQFGVNHLGHFALAAHLMEILLKTPQSRIVTVASAAHRFGRLDLEDPNWERRAYSKWAAYGQSKLANLLFLLELDHRLKAAGADVLATAGHPGWTATDLQRHVPEARLFGWFMAMKPEQGALPTLRAAVEPNVRGGEYFGPGGASELRGYPVEVGRSKWAQQKEDAAKLWRLSEQLTGVSFGSLDAE